MSDSDDEVDPTFNFLKPNFNVVYEDDEDKSTSSTNHNTELESEQIALESVVCYDIEMAWLNQDIVSLEDIQLRHENLTSDESVTIRLVLDVINGSHISLFYDDNLDMNNDDAIKLVKSFVQMECNYEAIRQQIYHDVISCTPINQHIRCLKYLVLGSLLLDMYCQANYTGPEFNPKDIQLIAGASSGEEMQVKIFDNALNQLECDGDYPFPICCLPNLLLVSRCILALLASPTFEYWRSGIKIDVHGSIERIVSSKVCSVSMVSACSYLRSSQWQSARAAVIHLRLLQKQSFEHIPTLWKECSDNFLASISAFELNIDKPRHLSRELQCQLWLEWGLCMHYFEYKDKGKACFQHAQAAIQLQTSITAAPGKRTKYQRNAVAQLYIVAKSSLVPGPSSTVNSSTSENTTTVIPNNFTDEKVVSGSTGSENDAVLIEMQPVESAIDNAQAREESSSSEGWTHSEWEMGRRLVRETERGEEAALREIKLDDCDGGAAENIIIEGGPKFTDEVNTGGELHCLDQTVLLSLCLDVANSNPVDGLTNEEMLPYIERVLAQPSNWMIYSMGLLQRSWLEYERRKTADRALLQMQALVDQHTTRLTITQSTYKSIEESAGSAERLRYIHSIAYPAQYEFKRDLANKYLRYEVLSSALNLFKELQMWDEVVTCYQLMDKPQRAELVVRDRLKFGATPYMLTSLGDLTGNEECYEEAWILSKGRFARAKRTLARNCFHRQEYSECVRHMSVALAVHPLIATSWYLMGLACMHIRDWKHALEAFTRCVQQDMEIGEAWANIGAIYMELKELPKAHVSFVEALKQKRDSWKIIENLLYTSLELSKWFDVILYSNMLLDQVHKLKAQSQSPVHIQALRKLVLAAVTEEEDEEEENPPSAHSQDVSLHDSSEEVSSPEKILLQNLSQLSTSDTNNQIAKKSNSNASKNDAEAARARRVYLITRVETLLTRIINTVDSDSAVWDVVAVFYTLLNKPNDVKEARVKEVIILFITTFIVLSNIIVTISCWCNRILCIS